MYLMCFLYSILSHTSYFYTVIEKQKYINLLSNVLIFPNGDNVYISNILSTAYFSVVFIKSNA